MLVLSRRVGDEITLPELNIKIRLLDLRGAVAKLGVEAPRELTVLRGELNRPAESSETELGTKPGTNPGANQVAMSRDNHAINQPAIAAKPSIA